jgi:anti-anti-sigma factor
MIKFTYNQNENALIWTLSGRFDTFACGQLSEMILGKINAMKGSDDPSVLLDGTVVFDMKEVEYISSAFFRISMSVLKQLHKGNFRIINCNQVLKNTFEIAGLTEILQVS